MLTIVNNKNGVDLTWADLTLGRFDLPSFYLIFGTARFSKKSPWSVFFRGEMSVICHKITVKCR
jgi:aromatic ring-cleaving dioxygenase